MFGEETNQPREHGRILIIEDDPTTVDLLRALLEAEGYRTMAAGGREDGIRHLVTADLILVDLVLPDGLAIDICRFVRSTPRLARHPIILLSTDENPNDRDKCLEAGADDYLSKPFDPAELIIHVRALLHAREIEADLRQHARQLSALRHLTSILVNTVDVSDLAQRIVDAVPLIFGDESRIVSGVLCTVDGRARTVQVHAITQSPNTELLLRHLGHPLSRYQLSLDTSSNPLLAVAHDGKERESNRLLDLISTLLPISIHSDIAGHLESNGGVAIPVKVQGRLIGIFLFVLTKPIAQISQFERDLMRDFVDATGIALENVRLYAEASRLIVTDGLTGVANRRRFDQALDEEAARARRLGYPVALLLVDVDHFKYLNDNLGHQAGDAALRLIAQGLIRNTRRTDLVARYGGDEFAIILPGASFTNLLPVGEKIRHAIQALISSSENRQSPTFTVSIGGAASTPPTIFPETLLRDADTALYAAKRDGRDCLRIVDSLGTVYP